MTAPHRIRLRHPWQQSPSETGTCWRRRFNRPSGLAGCALAIVVTGLASPGQLLLNGVQLGTLDPQAGTQRFVLANLPPHNELVLTLEGPSHVSPTANCVPGEVALEILAS